MLQKPGVCLKFLSNKTLFIKTILAVMEEATAGSTATVSSSSMPQARKMMPAEELPRLRLEWQEAPVHG
jgi:hypothetical protein